MEVFAKVFISVIMFCILVFIIIIWTVVGFLFWIPILFRSVIVFSIDILRAVFQRSPGKVPSIGYLSFASSFYVKGYTKIIGTIYGLWKQIIKSPLLEDFQKAKASLPPLDFKLLVRESAWSFLTWAFLFIAISCSTYLRSHSNIPWSNNIGPVVASGVKSMYTACMPRPAASPLPPTPQSISTPSPVPSPNKAQEPDNCKVVVSLFKDERLSEHSEVPLGVALYVDKNRFPPKGYYEVCHSCVFEGLPRGNVRPVIRDSESPGWYLVGSENEWQINPGEKIAINLWNSNGQ